MRWRKRTLPPPKKTGIGYKVFVQKDGKLYPPMVNPSGEATPVGEWLDAEAGSLAAPSKTGRQRVQAGGKGTNVGKQTLAYRPGWHLGKIPYALQFNKGEKVPNPQGVRGKNGEVIKVGRLFPANFVWAEVEYAKDVDYQDEAMSYGMKNGKFNHALAGLPRIPENGSYEYRTNANPATDPWVITGAMKVTRVLSNAEVDDLVRKAGREPQERENPESNEFKPNFRRSDLSPRSNVPPLMKAEMDAIAKGFPRGNGDFIRGWLLPDGRNVELLPDENDDWVDHDDVRAVLSRTRDVSDEPTDPLFDADGRKTMLAAGGVRYHMLGDEGVLDVWREPTNELYDTLGRFAEYDHEGMSGTKTLTVSFGEGDTIEYGSLAEMRKRLVGDIKSHFSGEAETPDHAAIRAFHTGWRRSNFVQNADAAEVSRRLGASPAELALLAEAPIKLFDMGREDRLNAASFTKNATELELVRSGGRVFSRTGFKAVTDVIREWAQDYNIRLRRLEERLGVGKDESAYHAADRSYGRVEQLWGQYQVNRVRPLMEALKRAGCTTPEDFADFGMYLVAKHGEEYNAMLAQRSRWVAEALDNPTARTVVDAVLAGTRDLDDAAMADVKAAMGWNDEQLDLFRRGLTGSSQSTAFWKRMLADRYDATGKTARFADAERIVRDMTEDFRRLLVDSGRLSPAQADTWRRLSPNYVPMMHDEEGEFDVWQKFFWGSDVAEAPKRSKAYGNSEVKHAFGRETMPENPVYFIVQQYQSAVLRSADNEVRRTLANLVRKYEAKHAADPNAPRLGVVFRYMGEDEFKDAQKRIGVLQAAVAGGTATAAQVAELARLNQAVAEARNAPGNIPTTKAVGSNGLVYEIPEVASVEQKNPEIVAFKEDGDLKFVRLGVASSQVDVDNGWLATSDARSIGAALKKQTLVTSRVSDFLRKLTGWYSAMRTAYSPTFMLSNFMADNTQAARNLYATFGAGAVPKFEHFAFHGFGAARAVLNDRYGTTLIQQYAKEWADNGGRIGGMATENVADIRRKFDRQLRLMDSSFRSLAQCRTAKDVIRLLGDKRYRLREFVEHANAIVEMGTRIAAYATHREMTRGNGKTDAENIADAISYSRDVTVNFNRKGRLTPIINALFAFSNASVQDFERSLRAFGDGRYASGAAGVARIGLRTGLRMGAGLFVLGFLSSWLGYAQDDDEDEKKGVPQWDNAKEYVKQSQITVRFGQRTFHIPIRGLSNLPYYMGHKLFEVMRRKTSAGRAAWQTAQTAFGDVIDVIGGAPTFAQAVTPSVFRPGVEHIQNTSFTGSNIFREPQFGKTDVLSQMGRGSTHEIWKGLARALNEIGTLGHGKQRTSWLDFQPEKLQHYWNWLGGSVGRDVGQAAGTLWDILHGEVPDVRNAFAVSRFVGKVDENSAKFYEARDEWQSAVDELKRIDPTDEAAVAEFVREHPFLAPQNRRVADELTDLAAISKKLLTTEMRSASDEERKTAHEMRLRAQWLFMDQYRSNERMDREERSDMRLMERFAKRTGAAERREKRKGQRELRGTMRKIPLLGE